MLLAERKVPLLRTVFSRKALKTSSRLRPDSVLRIPGAPDHSASVDDKSHSGPLAPITVGQNLFRVVGYLPGTGAQAMIAHDLRAGVAQASGEETAENANAGVQGANSMGIRAAVWRPKLAGKRRQCAIALGRGLAQLRWRALRRKCPELWSAARSAGHAPTPPRSPSASTSKTSDGSGVCS